MKLTGKANRITLSVNGKRCGVTIDAGPWVDGVAQDMIKIRPKQFGFSKEMAKAFTVENNSDSLTDYFENDCIRLTPGHPLYESAKSLA